jgi:hypothetical protein
MYALNALGMNRQELHHILKRPIQQADGPLAFLQNRPVIQMEFNAVYA